MPIKQENRHLYPRPVIWREIRSRILKRALHCCDQRDRRTRHVERLYPEAWAKAGAK